VNLLVSHQVGGSVTVNLEEMPWEQALAIILNSQGLARGEKDGIIIIYKPNLQASVENSRMPPLQDGDDKC
jgi:type IV pilus assembly protein PilQ